MTDIHTKKRIHEHLRNQQDVISDIDIRNAKTAFFGSFREESSSTPSIKKIIDKPSCNTIRK
jgi:hypothetical protein